MATTTSLSKEEYLKRYLSPSEGGPKKKKKKVRKTQQTNKSRGLKIVDDDVSWNSIAPKELEEEVLTDEDKPQIAVIDNRTEEEKKLDEYRKNDRWKTLGEKEKDDDDNENSDSDLDVHRRPRMDSDSDLDVKRKSRYDSDSDLDVKRKNQNDSESDLEVQREQRIDSDSDLDEIPRNRKSSPQKSKRHDSDSDIDIPRKKSTKQAKQMSSGGKGGLTSRKELKEEMKKFRKKDTDLDKLAKHTKENETVYREKGGKKRDMQREKQAKDAKDEITKQRMDKYEKWGRGVVQTEQQSMNRSDLLHEASKPLARYADDKDLDALQREAIRDGDPMAKYIAQKKEKETNKPKFPKYQGPQPAPNRYNIPPGYRWDSVNRSNGFERRYFESMNNKSTFDEQAYKWSVADM